MLGRYNKELTKNDRKIYGTADGNANRKKLAMRHMRSTLSYSETPKE